MPINKDNINEANVSKIELNKKVNVSGGFSMRRVGLALGLSAMIAVPGFALAGPAADDDASYQLSYSSAELRSVESVKALHLKIRRVALDYCPDYAVTKNLSERASCIKDVESDLVSQVDNALLTRIHSGDSGMSIASANR